MNPTPDRARQARLKLDGFKDGEQIMFCPACDFQHMQPVGAVPECPECGARLHLTRVTDELRDLTAGYTRITYPTGTTADPKVKAALDAALKRSMRKPTA